MTDNLRPEIADQWGAAAGTTPSGFVLGLTSSTRDTAQEDWNVMSLPGGQGGCLKCRFWPAIVGIAAATLLASPGRSQDVERLRRMPEFARPAPTMGVSDPSMRALSRLDNVGAGLSRADRGRSSSQTSYSSDEVARRFPERASHSADRSRTEILKAVPARDEAPQEQSTLRTPPEEHAPELLSAFERQVASYGDALVGRPVLQFGYGTFGASLLEPTNRPVGPDYIIGVADELILSLWGTPVDDDLTVQVAADGQVRLPLVGLITLRGLTMAEAQAALRREYDNLYKNYRLQLRVGRLREITVHVIGRVDTPGPVRVTSVAALFDALSAAGGISKDGSLRAVRLRRTGYPERTIDLYSYLLEGDLSVDVTLQANDVIVVPAVGPRVAVTGRVLRPGIYEINDNTVRLSDALEMAGGYARLADRRAVQIESVTRDGLSARTANLESGSENSVELTDGDVAIVRPTTPKIQNVVYVAGNVSSPGRYAFESGMRISDLLDERTLVEAGYWLGRRAPDGAQSEQSLPEPFLEYALIERIHPQTLQESRVAFHLGRAVLDNDPSENHLLQSQDTVVVFPRSAFESPEQVFVSGAVNKPGQHRFYDGMTVKDLIHMAGGLLREAHLTGGVLTRLFPEQKGTRYEHIDIDLHAALDGLEGANRELWPDDALTIKTVPEHRKTIRVKVEGEVRHPGEYTMIPGERLSDLIARAGGYTPHAYLPAARFLSEKVRRVQEESLRTSLTRLELETKLATQEFTADAAATGDEVDVEAEQERVERLITTIENTPSQGRRIVRLADPVELRESDDDFELENQDVLTIPRRPQDIMIVGAVFNQSAVLFRDGQSVEDYLNACGGALDTADVEVAYIIRADGSTDSARHARKNYRWDAKRFRYSKGDLFHLELFPGDTVVVPYDVKPKLSGLGITKTVTQILFQAALSTGVIIALL